LKYTSKVWVNERGRWISKLDKVYATRTKDGLEYRFNINSLPDFLEFMQTNYVTDKMFVTETVPLLAQEHIDIPLQKHWKLREYQEPVFNHALDISETRTKLIDMQTGKGKGGTSLAVISKLGYRTVVIIKPAYIEKWFIEIQEVLQIKPKEIMTVQGSDQLRGLFDMAHHGLLKSKFILISNRTYANYIKAYETNQHSEEFLSYGCHPDDFYHTLKAGILLIDEVHQDFHLNFKVLLYAQVQLAICMSASLMHHNHFMEKMYEIAFPKDKRYKGLELDRYLKVFPVNYHFKNLKYVRTTEYGKTTYSHMAFEKSIMHNKLMMNNYVSMIKFWIEYGFIKDYKQGDKVLIFASSIAMCTELTRRFKAMYPRFDVRRYVEDDPYENIINADMTITTILSGGTAIDVPNLRMALLTINVDSIQSNIQSSGRLRKLPDRDVKFFYLYCDQIQKHKDYHHRRSELLKDRVSLIKELAYNYPI
jgi:superfamily II DNA or RNA helicase